MMQKAAMSITPQEALQRTVEHREIFHDEMVRDSGSYIHQQ